jgi:glucose/mannose-6-phosphate isomerase
MDSIINQELLKQIDKDNMFAVLQGFPQQCRQAVGIGKGANALPKLVKDKIFILGMGGSAIGGDILTSYFSSKPELDKYQISVNRDYKIPGSINSDSAVIASSYSGGTEETIEGVKLALKHTGNIGFITTGGKLGEIADEQKLPKVIIPGGFMPRCALGFSFFPMLSIISKSIDADSGLKNEIDNDIEIAIQSLENKSKEYSELNEDNPAILLAHKIADKIPVIYSSNLLASTNLRWRCQIQENAKHLCWGHVLPEMNHNEINSWTNPKALPERFVVLTLEDSSDNPKVKTRFDAVRELLKNEVHEVIRITDNHDNLLARMFNLIYLGDWVSYYLAIINGEDPTPIPLISRLKEILSGS